MCTDSIIWDREKARSGDRWIKTDLPRSLVNKNLPQKNHCLDNIGLALNKHIRVSNIGEICTPVKELDKLVHTMRFYL